MISGVARPLLALLALAAAVAPTGAAASNFGEPGDRADHAQVLLLRIEKDEALIQRASADVAGLRSGSGTDFVLGQALDMVRSGAELRYREAVRAEQRDLLTAAQQPELDAELEAIAPPELARSINITVRAWWAIWRLAGIDEFDKVRIHPRPLDGAAPPGSLLEWYREAAARYQVDWTLLASINFIESDFGRVNGPSSAGAQGPMQFMPATWEDYGDGDILNPHDAIWAAARYLFLHGVRTSPGRAIFAYNQDYDYVEAVQRYADLIRADPGWLNRLYYWSTIG